jgi:AcrR family transcriptional regulator
MPEANTSSAVRSSASPRNGRREAILDAADALIADRGVERFRLHEAATMAGVAKATLFRWFSNRGALLGALEAERGIAPATVPSGRREQVIAAATRLIAMQGVRSTTMEQVASAAGVSTPTLYWHFASKDALVRAVISTASPLPVAQKFFSERATGDLRADLIAFVHLAVELAPSVLLVLRIASDQRDEVDPIREVALNEAAMPFWSLLGAYFDQQVTQGNLMPGNGLPRVMAFAGMVLAAALARASFDHRVIDDVGSFAEAFVTTFVEGAATDRYRAEVARHRHHSADRIGYPVDAAQPTTRRNMP